MKTTKLLLAFAAMALYIFPACSGGNQGVNEAGSADSDSMMNTDTQFVDTSFSKGPSDTTGSSDPSRVPVPTP